MFVISLGFICTFLSLADMSTSNYELDPNHISEYLLQFSRDFAGSMSDSSSDDEESALALNNLIRSEPLSQSTTFASSEQILNEQCLTALNSLANCNSSASAEPSVTDTSVRSVHWADAEMRRETVPSGQIEVQSAPSAPAGKGKKRASPSGAKSPKKPPAKVAKKKEPAKKKTADEAAPKKRVYKRKSTAKNIENALTSVPVDLPQTSPVSPPIVTEVTQSAPPPPPVQEPVQYALVENSSAVVFPVPPPEQPIEEIAPAADLHLANDDMQASDIVNEAFNLAQTHNNNSSVAMPTVTVATPQQPGTSMQEIIEVVLEESPTNSPKRVSNGAQPVQGDGLWLPGTASVSFFDDLAKKNKNLLLSTVVTGNNVMNSCDLLLGMRRNHGEIAAHQCKVMAIVSKIQSALVKYVEEFDSCRREFESLVFPYSPTVSSEVHPLQNYSGTRIENVLEKLPPEVKKDRQKIKEILMLSDNQMYQNARDKMAKRFGALDDPVAKNAIVEIIRELCAIGIIPVKNPRAPTDGEEDAFFSALLKKDPFTFIRFQTFILNVVMKRQNQLEKQDTAQREEGIRRHKSSLLTDFHAKVLPFTFAKFLAN